MEYLGLHNKPKDEVHLGQNADRLYRRRRITLPVSYLVKRFPAFYSSQRFIIVFTSAQNCLM
jgi:hypothetical protein